MLSTATTTDRGRRNADASESADADLSEDDVFEVLSNRRRRYVIHALKRAEEPLDVSDLSTHVTAWELDVDPGDVQYEDRRNVHSTLRRTHLPKLEEKNVVTVDEETKLVAPTDTLQDLEIYVEVLREKEIPWSLYYVGLAGIVCAVLLAVGIGVPGLGALTALHVGVFAVTAFGVSAVVHHLIGQRTRLGSTEKPPELRSRE